MKKTFFIYLFIPFYQLVAQSLPADLQTVFEDYDLMGLSVWVSINGEESSYHYGLRDFGRNLAVTSDTHFRIASISKMFTALGLLKLYDDGLFSLDDDISTILGYQVRNPQFPNTPITYKMLLSHQSSLQDGTGYEDFLNATYTQDPIPNIAELLLPEGIYYTSNMWRTEDPGTYFTYSNINFGLIATLIEKITSQRFDEYMKGEILEPLAISGSFNIQDLNNINNLAVLYRYNNGWIPQVDNYLGIMPPAPDLSNYIPGTNGVYFSPQGGLRVSATDTGKILSYLQTNGITGNLAISEATLVEMKSVIWDFNGSNGDNYFGLFNRWGLGMHHANVSNGDQICNLGSYGSFLGHPGEAYGLVSDAYFLENEPVHFALMINGIQNGYTIGTQSSYYSVEEAIFLALCNHFEEQLSTNTKTEKFSKIHPNPAKGKIFIELLASEEAIKVEIISAEAKVVYEAIFEDTNLITLDSSSFSDGIYFLILTQNSNKAIHKIFIQNH